MQKEHKTPPIGARIPDGPIHRGFDYYHGFHHARNMEAVIENDSVIAHDDVINMLPRLTRKSVEYIDSRAGKDEPFFLYVPLGSPHTPIVPTPEWEGKSGLGKYGDFVMQTDNVVGEISAALKKHQMTETTLGHLSPVTTAVPKRRASTNWRSKVISSAPTCADRKPTSGMADTESLSSSAGLER